MMQNNLLQLLQMFKGGNPQQIAMNMLQQRSGNNPIFQNVMNMVNNGDMSGVEQVARNICKEKGIDADQLMNQVQQQLR